MVWKADNTQINELWWRIVEILYGLTQFINRNLAYDVYGIIPVFNDKSVAINVNRLDRLSARNLSSEVR